MAMTRNVKTLALLCLILLFGVAKIECGLRGRRLGEDKGELEASGGLDKVLKEKSGDSTKDPDEKSGDSDKDPNEKSGDSDKDSDEKSGDSANAPTEASDDSDKNPKEEEENGGSAKAPAEASGDSDKDPNEDNGDSAEAPAEAIGDSDKVVGKVGGGSVFDVTKYGAQGDGKKDNTQAFMQAWVAACKNGPGPATVRVPSGNFVLGSVVFQGPCKGKITVEVVGTVIATTDLSDYPEDSWILFERVNGVVLTGGGTFNGKGASAWPYNNCKKSSSTCNLPTSIKFIHVTDAEVHNIKSVDSKFFHFHVTDSSGFKAYNVTIVAPAESPNTDGIHLSDTDKISITNSHIGTGDDCISVGQGVVGCDISNVFCGPGHGISIGSLGKRQNEAAVNGITVTDCTLSNTDNGVRIKTFSGSPPGTAAAIHFSNIAMEKVKNPIIIDQFYGSDAKSGSPSRVKLSDVTFSKIHGSSISDVAVSLMCSSAFPCPVQMEDINLTYEGKTTTSECSNAKITYKGEQNPSPCK